METNIKITQDVHEDSVDKLHDKVDNMHDVIFQLHENTVPRLFMILPQNGEWDWTFSIERLLTKQYHLHFLCEHEENGKAKFHLAFHKGYLVKQPKEV